MMCPRFLPHLVSSDLASSRVIPTSVVVVRGKSRERERLTDIFRVSFSLLLQHMLTRRPGTSTQPTFFEASEILRLTYASQIPMPTSVPSTGRSRRPARWRTSSSTCNSIVTFPTTPNRYVDGPVADITFVRDRNLRTDAVVRASTWKMVQAGTWPT